MRYLKRLSDSQLYTDVLPWDFEPATPLPEEIRSDKKARDAWINLPGTNHHVYTLWEGINGLSRVTKAKKDGEGNPPLYWEGPCADYDHSASLEQVLEFARKMPFVPNFVEKTLSGNWRYVWLFEKPMRVPSYSFAVHLLKKFPEFAFDPARGMMGFDKPAWEAPERLWTNGCEWYELHTAPIPADVSQGWLMKAMEKFEFSQREFGSTIPLEVVEPALRAKYPKMEEWPGAFEVGSHGPTFWVEASRSPKSATIYENGIRTFSENAHKTFFSWAELLGAAFVKEHQAKTAGEASRDIYFDGKEFWRKFTDGCWHDEDQSTLARHLLVERGVSKASSKDEPVSEMDRTLNFITSHQRVVSARPAIFRPSGLLEEGGRRTLNVCTVKVLQPSEGPAIWGDDGKFPWISKFIDALFNAEQRRVLLAWAAWGYRHAYNLNPRSGQVMFIAGPVGVGKTLLNRAILGKLFGGAVEAGNWLLGNTQFNSELFYTGFWVVDDADASSDPGKRKQWSAALKRVAANREFQFNEKFKQAGMVEWMGRVCVTMNGDEESARLLPDMDISNMDKVIILRTCDKIGFEFPVNLKEILDRELPHFAKWLLDWEIPVDLMGSARFGVKSYHEGAMLDDARQSSPQAGFADLLEIWRDEYFRDNPKETHWEGTAAKLHMAICASPARQAVLGSRSPDAIGRALTGLLTKDYPGLEKMPRTSGSRCWKIFPNKPLDTKPEPV